MKKKPYLIVKRIIDIICSILGLIILIPFFLIIAIAIKIESKGPVIFKQKRIGKDGQVFEIYKFRSMVVGAEKMGTGVYSKKGDSRVTKVGKFIRATSIDELPQLLNILKGEMSFIGPRPWIPEYYEFFTEEQKRRSDVLPGISGLAQVKGRNKINIFKKINYDIEYVDKISLLMDIKIIFLTIKQLFEKDEAEIAESGIKEEIQQLRISKENN